MKSLATKGELDVGACLRIFFSAGFLRFRYEINGLGDANLVAG